MSRITYLVGLPGSGKSTYTKTADAVVISTDGIRAELYGDESVQGDGARVFAIAHGRALKYLAQGRNVVLDATNLTVRARKRAKCYKALGYEVEAIVIDTPLEVCLERNAHRHRKVPEQVIRGMHTNMVLPTVTEGFDRVATL